MTSSPDGGKSSGPAARHVCVDSSTFMGNDINQSQMKNQMRTTFSWMTSQPSNVGQCNEHLAEVP